MGVIASLEHHKHVSPGLLSEVNPLVVAFWAVLALFGVYGQISSKFRLPFPINIPLLLLTIAEQLIIFAVKVLR